MWLGLVLLRSFCGLLTHRYLADWFLCGCVWWVVWVCVVGGVGSVCVCVFCVRICGCVHVHTHVHVCVHMCVCTTYTCHCAYTYLNSFVIVPISTSQVDFQFQSALHSALAHMFYNEVVRTMVSAFQKRCYTLYGPDFLNQTQRRRKRRQVDHQGAN